MSARPLKTLDKKFWVTEGLALVRTGVRKQKGFKEEITLSNPGSLDATAISLWENKANAEAYNTNTYPEVLRKFARMIDGTPKVHTFDAVTSTFHNAPVAV